MAAGKLIVIGVSAAVAVVCCAAPTLIIGTWTLGLSAWSASAGDVLSAILIASIGLIGIWFYRRNRTPSSPDRDWREVDGNTRKMKS